MDIFSPVFDMEIIIKMPVKLGWQKLPELYNVFPITGSIFCSRTIIIPRKKQTGSNKELQKLGGTFY